MKILKLKRKVISHFTSLCIILIFITLLRILIRLMIFIMFGCVMCFTVLCCQICFIMWIWILNWIWILIEVICLIYIFFMRWWRRNNGLRGWTDMYFNFRDIVFMCNLTGSCSYNTLYNNSRSWTKIKVKANVEKMLFKIGILGIGISRYSQYDTCVRVFF